MLRILKNTIFLLLILIFYCDAYCTEIHVFTDVREVEINKSFNLTVEIDGDAKDFKIPTMPDFVVILKNTNKKRDKIIYTYEVAPKAEGIFTIPAITYGQTTTVPISIRVYKKQTTKHKYSYKDSNSSANAFVDTKIVYVNQVMYYTLSFKTNRDLQGNPSYVLPMFQDCWKSKYTTKNGYKLIGGENYFTFEVTTPLYPIREGTLTIDPSKVTIQYLNSPVESNFETEKVNVKVLPLPEFGKPDTFSGSVGRYNILAKVNKNNLKVNEPFVLTITIKGDGNINTISEPSVDLPDDIKKYSTSIKTTVDSFISSKQFQCVLIPLMEGEKTIPKIVFSYFDPDLKEYKEISTKQISIKVSGKQNISDVDKVLDEANKDMQENNDDTVSEFKMKAKIDVSKQNKMFIKNKIFIAFSLLLILLVIGSLIYRIRLIIISKDIIRVQKMKYAKLFIKYFQKVQAALSRYMQFKFYYNLDLALRMLLSSKTGCDYMFMTKKEIEYNLYSLNFDKQVIESIIRIFVDCDKFKFTCFQATQNKMDNDFLQLTFIKEQLDKML